MKDLLSQYFRNKAFSRAYVFMFDILIIMVSSYIVFLVFYGFEELTSYNLKTNALYLTISLIICNSASFYLFKTYRGVLRYSVLSDLIRIAYAQGLAYTVSFLILSISGIDFQLLELLRLFLLIFFLNIFMMFASRIIIKELYEMISSEAVDSSNRVFVFGTKQSNINISKSLMRSNDPKFKVLGFISEDTNMIGKKLLGIQVFGLDNKIIETLREQNVNKIIICPGKFENDHAQTDLGIFIDNNITLLTIKSPYGELVNQVPSMTQFKEVEIEDLLPRNPIQLNLKAIADNLEGKRIVITGAAGSIGSEIVRQVASFNPQCVILIDHAETPLYEIEMEIKKKWINLNVKAYVANVNNRTRIRQIFEETQPQYIFHAAAYKHVPMMENNVSEAIQNNVLGAKVMADLAVEFKVSKFVMVSTDKAVNPSNIMGCSKRICEIYVQSLAKHLIKSGNKTTQFITTRFGNVLGSNGSVIPLFRDQIKNGGPVTVTHPDIIRYFMTIPEACQLVLEAGSTGKNGEIYIFDMGRAVKILDLAKRMIQLSGTKNVNIVFTGLRNGEKLYEELLNVKEKTIKTHHEKIMIARVPEYDYSYIKKEIDDLLTISYLYDNINTVRKMKEIVPEFHSMNSPFESIDQQIEKQKFILDNGMSFN